MKIVQHIPNFVDGDEPEERHFYSLKELLAIEFVKEFKDDWDEHKFFQYSLDDNTLIAEYDNGNFWWVVGFLEEYQFYYLGLPQASYKEKK